MTSTSNEQYIGITTSLTADLTLLSISGDEGISNLFNFTLGLASEEQAIKPEDIVGKPVDFWMILGDGSKRNYNGYVSQFVSGSLRPDGLRSYQAVVVPWLWFLSKTCDHKIFQTKNAKDIIEDVFKFYGFTDYKMSVTKTCLVRDYCVQYGESAFDFVSRLMEEEGIFYYFAHEEGKHTMVLSDNTSSFENCTENELIYLDNIADEHLHSWSHNHAYITGKVTANSYSFEEPNVALVKEVSTIVKLDKVDKYEHYEYPYGYIKTGDAEPFIKARIEAEESQYHTIESSGTYRSLKVGGKFKIEKHECSAEEGKEYTIISMRFDASEDVGSNTGSTRSYFNQFVCVPVGAIPRPKNITPRPRVYGLQTAVVVGPSGEEIYTDKYGRVKVQFHWDRIGKKDEESSCWIRVSQSWAGKGWGGIIIPRVSQEVVVSFLDGNPDKPLITGQVYNAVNMPPYNLPANQTQSGFKTRSTKDGGSATFNELRFEDKKDSEEVYIHAQKDFNTEINQNRTTTIEEGDDTYLLKKGNVIKTLTEGDVTTVLTKGDEAHTLTEGNQTVELTKGDQTISLKDGKQNTTLDKGDQSLTLMDGSREIMLAKGDQTTTLDKGNYDLTLASGDFTTKIDSGKSSVEASDKIESKVGGNSSTIDTSKIELKVGGNSIKIESAGITLTCGGNSIKMDPSGITLKGMMVKVNADTMAELKGGAMVKVQGGITMIN
ncbi:MAG: type VI secretion system tip protein VgrG [Gammaproteobacteria bacterium]|nr:type VI secretion system tip protein VgrG [Gammaproteobacteria bacterium]